MLKHLFFIGTLLIFFGQSTLAQDYKFKKAFNGKNLKGWEVPDNNIWWSADNGVLNVKSGPEEKGSILWTKKSYENFVFETDFLFGDGTIDTGIFLRSDKQQIQIGISGSLKRDMTGSPYIPGKGYPVEADGVADLLKTNDWNTIKVKAVGPQYTVWLNGKQILEYKSEDVPDEGPIGLQLHGGKEMEVDFRNIRVAKI